MDRTTRICTACKGVNWVPLHPTPPSPAGDHLATNHAEKCWWCGGQLAEPRSRRWCRHCGWVQQPDSPEELARWEADLCPRCAAITKEDTRTLPLWCERCDVWMGYHCWNHDCGEPVHSVEDLRNCSKCGKRVVRPQAGDMLDSWNAGIHTQCGGKLHEIKFVEKRTESEPAAPRECPRCNGSGTVPCERCWRDGELECPNPKCWDVGIDCPTCFGRRRVDCPACDGVGHRDCPACRTTGLERT